MLRWLRFLVYAGFLWFVLISHGAAIRQALRLLPAEAYFAPAAPCLPCALVVLLASAFYAVWLAGGTVGGWKMPLPVHAIPVALLAGTLLHGPLTPTPDGFGALGPADRVQTAGERLVEKLGELKGSPCALPASRLEALLAGQDIPPPGYRSHGRALGYRVEVRPQASTPVRSLEAGARPGTLYLACHPDGKRYWLTSVITDGLPTGQATLLRDGVGKVLFLQGEVTP